jgi:hypothetical protein
MERLDMTDQGLAELRKHSLVVRIFGQNRAKVIAGDHAVAAVQERTGRSCVMCVPDSDRESQPR